MLIQAKRGASDAPIIGFALHLSEIDRLMLEIVDELASTGDTFSWSVAFDELLRGGHANSHLIGRWLGGEGERPSTNEADRRIGRQMADIESPFWQDFREALRQKDDRYFDEDGNLREDQVLRRMQMYQGKMRGTANLGFVNGSPVELTWNWRLGTKEHCEDCLYFASLSPYLASEIVAHPGDCSTACLFECDCHWEREDGLIGFQIAA